MDGRHFEKCNCCKRKKTILRVLWGSLDGGVYEVPMCYECQRRSRCTDRADYSRSCKKSR